MLFLFERIKNNEEDLASLFKLKSEPNDIYWSGYTSHPNILDFENWYQEQLVRSDRKIWLVKSSENPFEVMGYLYLTFVKEPDKIIGLVSHGVEKKLAGRGLGTAIVNFVVNIFINGFIPANEIHSWVTQENIASARTFTKNGFIKSGLSKEEFYKSMNKSVKLENYFFERNSQH